MNADETSASGNGLKGFFNATTMAGIALCFACAAFGVAIEPTLTLAAPPMPA